MSRLSSARGALAGPIVYLVAAVVLLVTSVVGLFQSAYTAPWIVGGIWVVAGVIALVRRWSDRRSAVLLGVGILCAAAAPFGQDAGLAVQNSLAARRAMAALGDRPAPPLRALFRLNGAEALPEWPERLTIVNFWATWCPPCIAEMPTLQSFAVRHAHDPVVLVGVTALYDGPPEEELARIQAFLDERGITYPNLVSSDGSIQEAFHAESLPTTVLIEDGEVVRYAVGVRDTKRLLDAAERRLAER
jgi:thiol-disulfide isomerase/thioredoxin